MQVRPFELVPAGFAQPHGLLLRKRTVVSGERGQVELELHPFLLEAAVVSVLHVDIPFGVRENGMKAPRLDAPEQFMEARRRAEIAGLHQQMVASGAQRKQVTALQTLLEQAVEHVLGREVQLHGTGIGRLQFGETLPQRRGCVRNVLHDVRREPDLGHSPPSILLQHLQRLRHRPHPVVDPWQHMAVPVGEPRAEQPRGVSLPPERPHHLL